MTSDAGVPPNEREVTREHPIHFIAPSSEYAAVRQHAAVADRSARSRGTFSGAKSAEVLTGLVTNDVLALTPGHGVYAAALTPKGKIISDIRVFARSTDFLIDVPPRAATGWWTMVKKFVNPRLAKYQDVSLQLSEVIVLGPKGAEVLHRVFGDAGATLGQLSVFGVREIDTAFGMATVARVPDYGVEAYSLFVTAERRHALIDALALAGAHHVGAGTLEVVRMEAGRPEWGIEIDDSTLPQEANFDELQAISYTKGCYTGQETVARVHFRGHVNRHLRGVRFSADGAIPAHAALEARDGKSVGDVRSVATSPRLGGIGLAMIRREVELESEVIARWHGGEEVVRVTELPFPGA